MVKRVAFENVAPCIVVKSCFLFGLQGDMVSSSVKERLTRAGILIWVQGGRGKWGGVSDF